MMQTGMGDKWREGWMDEGIDQWVEAKKLKVGTSLRQIWWRLVSCCLDEFVCQLIHKLFRELR